MAVSPCYYISTLTYHYYFYFYCRYEICIITVCRPQFCPQGQKCALRFSSADPPACVFWLVCTPFLMIYDYCYYDKPFHKCLQVLAWVTSRWIVGKGSNAIQNLLAGGLAVLNRSPHFCPRGQKCGRRFSSANPVACRFWITSNPFLTIQLDMNQANTTTTFTTHYYCCYYSPRG